MLTFFEIWAFAASIVVLFNYGASLDRKGGSRVDGSDRPANRAVASR